MRKQLLTLAMALAVGAAAPASAAVITYGAVLSPEALGALGTGTVTVQYDDLAHTLVIDTDFSGLSGVTTAAHIHCCTAVAGTGTIGVAVTPGTLPGFPVGVSSGSYLTTLDLTLDATFTAAFQNGPGGGTAAGAETALIAGINAGKAYFNIHSNVFPAGVIRGFLAPVPEPASLALLGLGLAGLVMTRRRTVRR